MLHPDPVQPKHVAKLMNSGALFARKFKLGTSDKAWSNIEGMLSKKVRASRVCALVACVLLLMFRGFVRPASRDG